MKQEQVLDRHNVLNQSFVFVPHLHGLRAIQTHRENDELPRLLAMLLHHPMD